MLLHDVNPQLMYVNQYQLENPVNQQESMEPQPQRHKPFSNIFERTAALFKSKQTQVACCEPACC
ncbi:hypothetical protein ACFPES_26730 [Paenibacillus sp. GCM10023248]|uniref:hypothetical protein n=1 Tax=unclassified Paenibacillus TaxID=185978 RepID=UPI0023781D08|nr:hypothetical protein [Paenibacillus sp. MAHUQ-63]MDD9270657.1 hypothetical protein [Paenibacillus sp. MAHUQ-63]